MLTENIFCRFRKKMYLCRRIERGAGRLRLYPMNLMQVMLP